ncbi:MAG: hypothetical protein M1814_003838 [Vezdaea aestivalis]|nr:MAG: hypothetical protein M1814_003838 [Vezdaea aestivalis]
MAINQYLAYLLLLQSSRGISVAERKGRGDIDCSTCYGPHADRLWCPVMCGTRIGYDSGTEQTHRRSVPVETEVHAEIEEMTEIPLESEDLDEELVFDLSPIPPMVVRVNLELTNTNELSLDEPKASPEPRPTSDEGLRRRGVFINETTRTVELKNSADRQVQLAIALGSALIVGLIAMTIVGMGVL